MFLSLVPHLHSFELLFWYSLWPFWNISPSSWQKHQSVTFTAKYPVFTKRLYYWSCFMIIIPWISCDTCKRDSFGMCFGYKLSCNLVFVSELLFWYVYPSFRYISKSNGIESLPFTICVETMLWASVYVPHPCGQRTCLQTPHVFSTLVS